MRGPLTRRFAAIATMSVVVLAVSPAMAQRRSAPAPSKGGGAKAACLAAHEDATSLLTQKKPHAAHDKFVACARAECPTVVRKECGEQLAIVEKDAPTVALEARDEAGMDTTTLKVTIDGAPIADRLTGAAIDVEPGEHVFRFERADGKAIEQKVLVVEGEKNRKVVADFRDARTQASSRRRRADCSARAEEDPRARLCPRRRRCRGPGWLRLLRGDREGRGKEPRFVVQSELQQ